MRYFWIINTNVISTGCIRRIFHGIRQNPELREVIQIRELNTSRRDRAVYRSEQRPLSVGCTPPPNWEGME